MSTIEIDNNIDGLDAMLRLQIDLREQNPSMNMKIHGYAYACPQDFVLQHGTAYDPNAFELVEGEIKACYRNSLRTAAENGCSYVEGYAMGGIGLDIHHAWCVKPDGTPVECTWEAPGDAYRGVVFPLRVALEALDATGSVLDDWQRGPILKERWQG